MAGPMISSIVSRTPFGGFALRTVSPLETEHHLRAQGAEPLDDLVRSARLLDVPKRGVERCKASILHRSQ
jgi:hypothetical protein